MILMRETRNGSVANTEGRPDSAVSRVPSVVHEGEGLPQAPKVWLCPPTPSICVEKAEERKDGKYRKYRELQARKGGYEEHRFVNHVANKEHVLRPAGSVRQKGCSARSREWKHPRWP